MGRIHIVTACSGIVGASYCLVGFGLIPESWVGPVRVSPLVIPAVVTGLALGVYLLWDARNARASRDMVEELHAQLVRKEIEVGRSSAVDELTGLYTRHTFDSLLRLEFERFLRHKRPACFLLIQVDPCENLGFQAGAMGRGLVLAETSGLIKQALRTIDVACRYSDDVLGVLLVESDEAAAETVVTRLTAAAAAWSFSGTAESVSPTISQGVVVFSPSLRSPLDVKHAAERALAEARASGTGQACFVRSAESDERAAA